MCSSEKNQHCLAGDRSMKVLWMQRENVARASQKALLSAERGHRTNEGGQRCPSHQAQTAQSCAMLLVGEGGRRGLFILVGAVHKGQQLIQRVRVIPICEFFLEREQTSLNIPACLCVHRTPGAHKSGVLLLLEDRELHTEGRTGTAAVPPLLLGQAQGTLGTQSTSTAPCPARWQWDRTSNPAVPRVNDLAAADRSSPSAFLSHWMISLKPELGKMPLMLP